MRNTATGRRTDAVALLKKDHEDVRDLLEELESARDAARKERLFEQIEEAVKAHSRCEEEIFYPAYRDAASKKEDRKLFFEATEEHHLVDGVMAEMHQEEPGSDEFAAKAKVLKDLIEHHADEEEDEMFPRAKRLLSKEELTDLGERIEQRKEELRAGGSSR